MDKVSKRIICLRFFNDSLNESKIFYEWNKLNGKRWILLGR